MSNFLPRYFYPKNKYEPPIEGPVENPSLYDEYISKEEHQIILLANVTEARAKAFEEAADSVQMIVGENDGYGITAKEVWDKAQSLRLKAVQAQKDD